MRIRAGEVIPTLGRDLAHLMHVPALQPGLGARDARGGGCRRRRRRCLLKVGPRLVVWRRACCAYGLAWVVVACAGLPVLVGLVVVVVGFSRSVAVGAGYIGLVA